MLKTPNSNLNQKIQKQQTSKSTSQKQSNNNLLITPVKSVNLLDKKKNNILTTGSTICSQKYLLSHHIGNGTFGDVYIGILAIDQKQNGQKLPKQVAIKVESNEVKNSQLPNQIEILKKLRKDPDMVPGFPEVFTSGSEGGNSFMVIQLLGPNLQDLLILCGGKFSLKTSLLLTIQILEKIQFLHSYGYVYRDIKPQNFVMGIQQQSGDLFMIDFGLCKPFKDPRTGLFMPYKENVSMVGTIRYASLNSHLGIEQTRRDDLQAIIYMLIYFLKGQLPWQGVRTEDRFQKDHVIMQAKLKISTKQLCQQLAFQIHNIFEYVKSLDFYQDPDYKYIISQLSSLYQRMGYILDFQYDWVTLNKNVQLQRGNLQIQLRLADDKDDQGNDKSQGMQQQEISQEDLQYQEQEQDDKISQINSSQEEIL